MTDPLMTPAAKQMVLDTIRREGKYVNHPADRGGPTNMGITLATLASFRGRPATTAADVRALSLEEAMDIYWRVYARPFAFLSPADPGLFKFLFNAAVQHGVPATAKMLQRAVSGLMDGLLPFEADDPDAAHLVVEAAVRHESPLDIDGRIGRRTRSASLHVLSLDQSGALTRRVVALRCSLYASLLRRDASQRVFASGWFKRVSEDLA